MRILFISRAYSPNAGGMERLSWELHHALSRLPATVIDLIAHRGSRTMAPFFILTCLPRALRLGRSADIIYLGDPLLSFVGWLLQIIYRKPVAVTVHGLDITYHNALYQAYLKLFFRSFQLYLPISRHVNKLLDHMRLGGRRTVLTPGIHDRLYTPLLLKPDPAKGRGILQTDDIVLLTVGRLVARKGQTWFITHVMPHLPLRVHYVIAGDGPAGNSIRRATAARDLDARVHLLGRVSDKQLAVLYCTADAFIQPNIKVSHEVEGFGLVLLEAALCNRPVFAANLEGIPDAVHEGKNGLLLPPQDAKAWIIALEQFISGQLPLPPNPRQYTLATFGWQKIAHRYRALLSRLA